MWVKSDVESLEDEFRSISAEFYSKMASYRLGSQGHSELMLDPSDCLVDL
jgi:hypothetical protein